MFQPNNTQSKNNLTSYSLLILWLSSQKKSKICNSDWSFLFLGVFDVLAYTDKDTTVPMAWVESDAKLINNPQMVKLHSFDTKVLYHFVTYLTLSKPVAAGFILTSPHFWYTHLV